MVAVERVGRYVEQLDAMHNKRQEELERAAVERHLKSKVVSKIVLWTLHNRRRFRETVMCAEPPMPDDEYCESQNRNTDPEDRYESLREQHEFVREYVVMDDPVRIDEFDDGDTDTDECRDDVEGCHQQTIQNVVQPPQRMFASEKWNVWPTRGPEAVARHNGVPRAERPVGTKRFSVECVGRDENIKSAIADQVLRTIQELRTDVEDPLKESSERPVETVEVEVKVYRLLNRQASSIETYSKNNLSVVTDQLDVPEPPSIHSWWFWWSTTGCWSCGE